MRVVKIILLCVFCIFVSRANAVVKGSESLISIEPYATLPAADSDNTLATFGYFKSGFGLQDATTSCTVKTIFPMSGNLNLHGGTIFLDNDLQFKGDTTLVSMGTIYGNGNVFDLSENVTGWANPYPSTLYDLHTTIHADFILSGTVNIHGNCSINGLWNNLILDDDANILIHPNSSLCLHNIEVDGISGNKIRCVDDSAQLHFDNVRWVQENNFSFTRGSILFYNDVNFVGPYLFNYESALTSTIAADSRWYLSDIVEVSLGRKNSYLDRNPIYFEDVTSEWRMENCTVNITSSGMEVINGTVTCDGEVKFDIDGTTSQCGLRFGDGVEAHDPRLRLYPGSAFNVLRGCFVEDTVNSRNLLIGDVEKKFIRQSTDSRLYIKQNLYFNNVELQTGFPTYTTILPGKKIFFDNCLFSNDLVDFNFTGTRLDTGVYLLDGAGDVEMIKGNMPSPLPLYVSNTGNYLRGIGNVAASIILNDASSVLTIMLTGGISSAIMLNGGTIIAGADLTLYPGAGIAGPGTVNLAANILKLNPKDGVWTSTVHWAGTDATIDFDSNVALAAPQTMTGKYTFVGNQNILNLSTAAGLIVAANSKLVFKDMTITGFSGSKIRCLDDSGSIEFINVDCIFDNDFTFTRGSMKITGDVCFNGPHDFIYQSSLTSTIALNSALKISDNMTLVAGRKNSPYDREPLYLTGKSSVLGFDSGNLNVTSNGMRLIDGTLALQGSFFLDIQSTNSTTGLILGNGNAQNDIDVKWGSGAIINCQTGDLVSELSTISNMRFVEALAKINAGFNLWVNTSATFSNIGIKFDSMDWGYNLNPAATIIYDNVLYQQPGAQYHITGQHYSFGSVLLDGDDEVLADLGDVPWWATVLGTNNSVHGPGGMSGSIVLADPSSEVSIGLDGQMSGNIILMGGKATLSKPLVLSELDQIIQGAGTINLGYNDLILGSKDTHWTSTIYWDGASGTIDMNADVSLYSTWTFSGDCVLKGNGNILYLEPTAQINVEHGSSLTLKNIHIKKVHGTNIHCLDAAASVWFDHVECCLSDDFYFNQGYFIVDHCLELCDGYGFYYQSDQQSKIARDGHFEIQSGGLFSYAPASAARNLIMLETEDSKLELNGATLHSTATGLQLTNGTLEVIGKCFIASDATCKAEGIIFGDGVSASNDLTLEVKPESNLKLTSGHLVYKNLS